jgi:ankyrin repeat protein
VPTVPLPDEPSLEQLRHQAKELQRAVRAGAPQALAELAGPGPFERLEPEAAAAFKLSAAQLAVARRYGFASWTRLKRHVEIVQRYSRFPDRMAPDRAVPDRARDPAERFLRLACLTYDDVGPAQWAEGRSVLAEHPEITEGSVHVAAAAGDVAALRRILAADPGAAAREGGPYGWEPLLYLAYARHDPTIAEADVLGAARLLLEGGADPNAGYLWHGLLSPFTALTGVLGEGEQGPARQPRHPHAPALGRLLLEAGADPNDAQALYNRMFEPDDGHLELLFEFGLGTGDGGPWCKRLGQALQRPVELVRGQLPWAIAHGMIHRVRLLADHGVDVVSPLGDGTVPSVLAATSGHTDLVEFLVGRGAPRPDLEPTEAFVTAALAADRVRVEQLCLDHPALVDHVRARRPGLVAWAAALGRPPAVELLVEMGFDVNAKGRTDVPSDQPWQTALHRAAETGDVDLARTLLRLGADPDIHDRRFDATPLGWAEHFGHRELVDLLQPVTTDQPTGEDQGQGLASSDE